MTQKSIQIIDGSGSEVLAQLNDAFETLATSNSGGVEPQPTYAGMLWLDTSGSEKILKQSVKYNLVNEAVKNTYKEMSLKLITVAILSII